jgi:hypothetical protein
VPISPVIAKSTALCSAMLAQGLWQRQGVLTQCVHGAPGLADAVHSERAGPADGRGGLFVAAVVAQCVGQVQLQCDPGQRVAEHVVDLAGDPGTFDQRRLACLGLAGALGLLGGELGAVQGVESVSIGYSDVDGQADRQCRPPRPLRRVGRQQLDKPGRARRDERTGDRDADGGLAGAEFPARRRGRDVRK